jgi:hypothetical protein
VTGHHHRSMKQSVASFARPLAAALTAATVSVAVSAAPADALSVTETVARTLSFAGAGCEEVTERATLPAPTRSARLVAPDVGAQLLDLDGQVVATVTRARIARVDGRRTISVTVQGDPSQCPTSPSDPSASASLAWDGELDVRARVRRTVRVFFPQVCCGGRHDERPRRLFLGASFFLDRVVWSRWGGSTATGRAQLPYNSCEPYCAEGRITWIPARVLLSRPRLCNGVYQYLTVRYTMTRRPPAGSRSGRSNFGFRCH